MLIPESDKRRYVYYANDGIHHSYMHILIWFNNLCFKTISNPQAPSRLQPFSE